MTSSPTRSTGPVLPAPASTWLRGDPDPAARARVFCIPQAGSSSVVFDRWPAQLDGVDLLPVELPGRLSRFGEPPPDSFAELAMMLAGALTPWLDRPFAFFGHCWSAIAAYEVTVHLEQQGRPPAHLYVSAEAPPSWGPYGRMLPLSDDALEDEIVATVQAMGRTPHPELVSLYCSILRHDVEMRRRYPPRHVRVEAPIKAYAWADDPDYDERHLLGWADCGTVTPLTLPGSHDTFTEAPAPLLHDIVSELTRTAP